MLIATTRLLDMARKGAGAADNSFEESACVTVIMGEGGREDADALPPAFLDDPAGRRHMLKILQWYGTADTGRRLFEALTSPDGVHEGVSGDVLQAIGYLGYEPAAERLLVFAENCAHSDSRAACLGLLDLQCTGLEKKVARVLDSISKNTMFPEFLPSIAIKAREPRFLDHIMKLGENTSADNISGVMLGVATFGAAGKPHFERFLREPQWEGDFASAGTPFFLTIGAYALGFKPTEVFSDIQADFRTSGAIKTLRYRLSCLLNLIRGADAGTADYTEVPRLLALPRQSASAVLQGIFGDSCWGEDGILQIAKAVDEDSVSGNLSDPAYRAMWDLEAALHQAALMRAMRAEFVK